MHLIVDLNADLGEGSGHDAELFELISSANVATGFHAGDPRSIFESIRTAKQKSVAVGAHPSFDDRENFGQKRSGFRAHNYSRSWYIRSAPSMPLRSQREQGRDM